MVGTWHEPPGKKKKKKKSPSVQLGSIHARNLTIPIENHHEAITTRHVEMFAACAHLNTADTVVPSV